jgi:hypothetical protein
MKMTEKMSAPQPSGPKPDVPQAPTTLDQALCSQADIIPSLCSTMPCDPAPVISTVDNLRDETKTDQIFLNEERRQVTSQTNNTHNASTNNCVRYFENGKGKQESDDNSSQARRKAENRSEKQPPKSENRGRARKDQKARTPSRSNKRLVQK